MSRRRPPKRRPPDDRYSAERLAPFCDLALERGEAVVVGDLVLLPDTVVLEGLANGYEPLPLAWQLLRDDGRCLYAFRRPKEWIANAS